jgi:hypothetical protein
MQLYSFKAPQGNFGDDLNAWLWPRVFGSDLDRSPHTTFIGIGSVLDRRLEQLRGPKIVFGAGVRSTHNLPNRDEHIQIRFVRGPISATVLGRATTAITDPAILVGVLVSDPRREGTRAVGVMPHYHSLHVVNWRGLCDRLGLVFIDPRAPVDQTIAALRGCDRIVTEAMHGAIVADALRIPWHRVSVTAWRREGFEVSSLKWLDWGLSAGVDVTPSHLGLEYAQPSDWMLRVASLPLRQIVRRRLAESLAGLRESTTYRLSSDSRHRELLTRVGEQVERMRAWLKST